jgi:uncharacterized Ntn-hydrolase superfamily protein
MTWSILARDAATGELGVAVATRFFAVGALCPRVEGGLGVIATQALVNPLYGPDGLARLRAGETPDQALSALLAADAGREHRQCHILPAAGHPAQYTGAACLPWCGHLAGPNVSVAGNMLAGPAVVEATLAAWLAQAGQPMALRLLAAMEAGEAAGGDRRGRQSAALQVAGGDPYPDLDLRVDDHPDPLAELRRLHAVAQRRYVHLRRFMPGRGHPGVFDRAVIEAAIEAARAREA